MHASNKAERWSSDCFYPKSNRLRSPDGNFLAPRAIDSSDFAELS